MRELSELSRSTLVAPPRKGWRETGWKAAGVKATAAVVLLTFLTVLFHGNWQLASALVGSGLGLWWLNETWQHYCRSMDILDEVQGMTFLEFAAYATELLRSQGYVVVKSGRLSGPQADLLLLRGQDPVACWFLHGRQPVRVESIAAAAAAVQSHKEWRALVVSSQRLTLSAWSRARREHCLIIPRARLAVMITQYRRGHRVLTFPVEEATRLRGRK
ncbi:MAG: restriction endonuclease [Deltaproteobacteria bacterium]|nr:restriction endonuclease [Deltaproteobacteria bacterium]